MVQSVGEKDGEQGQFVAGRRTRPQFRERLHEAGIARDAAQQIGDGDRRHAAMEIERQIGGSFGGRAFRAGELQHPALKAGVGETVCVRRSSHASDHGIELRSPVGEPGFRCQRDREFRRFCDRRQGRQGSVEFAIPPRARHPDIPGAQPVAQGEEHPDLPHLRIDGTIGAENPAAPLRRGKAGIGFFGQHAPRCLVHALEGIDLREKGLRRSCTLERGRRQHPFRVAADTGMSGTEEVDGIGPDGAGKPCSGIRKARKFVPADGSLDGNVEIVRFRAGLDECVSQGAQRL